MELLKALLERAGLASVPLSRGNAWNERRCDARRCEGRREPIGSEQLEIVDPLFLAVTLLV